MIPCIERRVDGEPTLITATTYGSILPAAWSFLLALRSRGLGSTWTTLHLAREREAAELLGIPDTVTQVALFPVAYTIGDEFPPAVRPPVEGITFWNTWGGWPARGREPVLEPRSSATVAATLEPPEAGREP